MKRKILSVLLCFGMIAAILPTSAFAADNYNLWIGTTQVTSDNAADVLGDGTVSYDNSTKTLTLDGATVRAVGYDSDDDEDYSVLSAIYSADDLNIRLIGSNTVEETGSAADESYGISCEGNLSITGDKNALLSVSGGGTGTEYYEYDIIYGGGIDVWNNLTINANVTAKGGAGEDSTAILAESIIINGGTVSASGGFGTLSSTGISGNIEINGGTVSASGGDTAYGSGERTVSCGVNAGTFSITKSTLTATGGTADASYGVRASSGKFPEDETETGIISDFNINERGKVYASACADNYAPEGAVVNGVMVNGNISIDGRGSALYGEIGAVTDPSGACCGVSAVNGEIYITNDGAFEAKCADQYISSPVVCATPNSVYVEGEGGAAAADAEGYNVTYGVMSGQEDNYGDSYNTDYLNYLYDLKVASVDFLTLTVDADISSMAVIFAEYDEDGALMYVELHENLSAKANEQFTVTKTAPPDGYEMKIMVWDSVKGMYPYIEAISAGGYKPPEPEIK